MSRLRYAVVGVGSRSRMYLRALQERYAEDATLVAICDSNQGRLDLVNRERATARAGEVPAYLDGDFDRMLDEQAVERLIVTSQDSTHDRYIVAALDRGVDVVTEKPMATDQAKCQRILDAVQRSERAVRVTFNYRYSPARTQIKDVLMSGAIGRVLSVDFHWLLDTRHGADYFRRWHRRRANSGGLLVHKATHHFDLVNWWLSSRPVEVFATGQLAFYRPETADRLGLEGRGERCLGCAVAARCPFHLDIEANERLRALYLEQEQHDGYFRDRCVFSGEIDIEDTVSLAVEYASGARMSYSLNAFSPREGLEIRFNGTRGRLEHASFERSYISGAGGAPGETIPEETSTTIYPHFGEPQVLAVWQGEGGHGGGDDPLLDSVFLDPPPADRYGRSADHVQGAWSILTGIAANHSIAGARSVAVEELVSGLAEPTFPAMPDW